jgi:hypothetical protein
MALKQADADLTDSKPVKPLGLLQKAVQLAHASHGDLAPAFFSDDCIDLIPEWIDVFGSGSEVEQRLREALSTKHSMMLKFRREMQTQTNHGAGVDSSKVEVQNPVGEVLRCALLPLGFVQQPR